MSAESTAWWLPAWGHTELSEATLTSDRPPCQGVSPAHVTKRQGQSLERVDWQDFIQRNTIPNGHLIRQACPTLLVGSGSTLRTQGQGVPREHKHQAGWILGPPMETTVLSRLLGATTAAADMRGGASGWPGLCIQHCPASSAPPKAASTLALLHVPPQPPPCTSSLLFTTEVASSFFTDETSQSLRRH